MADREENDGVVELLVDFGREGDFWFAEFVVGDFDIEPRGTFAKAGAEGFDDGLFGRKAAGKVGERIFVLEAVILFAGGKEAREEADAVGIDGLLDAVDFNDVVSDP